MNENENQIVQHWPFKDRPPRRVVVKIGSNVLSLPSGGLNRQHIGSLVASLVKMANHGSEILIVSSGAVAAGRGELGLDHRPSSIPELQAVAAIGQGLLMEEWTAHFRRYGIIVAQMLLNREDMDDRRRYLNARYALNELLSRGVIPIINENDCITIDELKFGDNDMLSAMIAAKMEADLLLILSNIPGLMTGHPEKNPDAELIPVVERLTPEHEALVDAERSGFGTGGMMTKLLAARHATNYGVTCAMVNGMKAGKIDRVLAGCFEGTLFLPVVCRRSGTSWRHWLSSSRPKGDIIIDDGAAHALLYDGKSLLAVGIVATGGKYEKGDVVSIRSENNGELAHGIVNYDKDDVEKIQGKKGPEIARLYSGLTDYTEVVHRNHMVILAEHE